MRAENSGGFAPSCSVVICTRNRPLQLEQCLEAVGRLVYPRFDVLVVDNAPSDARAQEIARRWGARYLVEPRIGLSRSRNRGARACESEVVAFLDDDAVPEPQWLSGLAEEFSDPLVMAVAGRIVPLGAETDEERIKAFIAGAEFGGEVRKVVDRQNPRWFELANFGGVGNGANIALRRHAFELWPGFDERLGKGALLEGCEEHHAFFSLIEQGYRVVYTPGAVVRHPYPHSPEVLRARYLKAFAASGGYVTLLLVEAPRYRRVTLNYLLEGLRGIPRSWRTRPVGLKGPIAPRWRVMLAWLLGPALYVLARLRSSLKSPSN